MSPEYVRSWLFAFTFTQLIEIPIYRRMLGCSWARAFGATALTHPLIWFVLFPRLPWTYPSKAALAEAFAWLAEALWFAPTYGLRRAALIALLANAASFTLGLLSRALLGVP